MTVRCRSRHGPANIAPSRLRGPDLTVAGRDRATLLRHGKPVAALRPPAKTYLVYGKAEDGPARPFLRPGAVPVSKATCDRGHPRERRDGTRLLSAFGPRSGGFRRLPKRVLRYTSAPEACCVHKCGTISPVSQHRSEWMRCSCLSRRSAKWKPKLSCPQRLRSSPQRSLDRSPLG